MAVSPLKPRGGVTLNDRTVVDATGVFGAFPIGSIYLSVNSTSPASLFGGTWEKIKDKFLLASGDTYTNGATGGEATHTLTVEEMPSHSHNVNAGAKFSNGNSGKTIQRGYGDDTQLCQGDLTNTGGGQAHNNMPPYLVVNIWKRVS